jgi:hypothetical protein
MTFTVIFQTSIPGYLGYDERSYDEKPIYNELPSSFLVVVPLSFS